MLSNSTFFLPFLLSSLCGSPSFFFCQDDERACTRENKRKSKGGIQMSLNKYIRKSKVMRGLRLNDKSGKYKKKGE